MKISNQSQGATKSKGFFLKKIVLCTLLAFASPYAFAAVTDVHCESGDDLHVAIANAAPADTLNITGTCFANGSTFTINKNLALVGKDASAILDGGNTATTTGVPVLWVQPGATVRVDKLTIQNGYAASNLAWVTISRLNFLASNVTNEGTLTIKRSNILNGLNSGQGVILQESGNLRLEQSLVASNVSTANNRVSTFFHVSGNSTIINSTFTENKSLALVGLVVSIFSGTMNVYNSTFYHNNDENAAGALFITGYAGNLNIYQSILSHNGRDIFAYNPATVTVNNSFTGNTVDLLPIADNGGPTWTMKPDASQVGGNPAINAVSATDCASLAVDQRGAPRPGVGKTSCDAGAYEMGDPQLAVTSASPLNFGTVQNGNSLSLQVSIQNTGNDDLVLAEPVIAPLSSNFSFMAGPAYPLAVKAQSYFQELGVTYTPTANQTDNATLTLAFSNDVNTVSGSQDIPLIGIGAGFIVPPIQQIQDLLAVLNNPLQNNLYGVGKGNSAANKYNAFVNMIKSAGSLITNGKYPDACSQLMDASKKVDGKDNPPDFVSGTGAPAVYQSIVNLMSALYCPPQQ